MFYQRFTFKIGPLVAFEADNALLGLFFASDGDCPSLHDGTKRETPLLAEVGRQLTEYFAGTRREFDLPLIQCGTEFQRRVWAELKKIPYGKTISYGELAKKIGSPKAARAVGGANNKNPIAIVVPCHRVIGSGGALVGYAAGVDKKRFLLELERRVVAESR